MMKRLALVLVAVALGAAAVGCSRAKLEGPTADIVLAAAATPADGAAKSTGDMTLGTPINAFGFDLLREREKNAERGAVTVVSPLSVHAALAMTANGANAETLAQMRKVLRLDRLGEEVPNGSYADLLARLNAATDVKLSVANSLWLDEGFPVKRPFLEANRRYFGAEMHSLDLQTDAAMRAINEWVSSATQGKIPKLLDQPLADAAVVDLVNATYFKGDWETPFDANSTADQPFHLLDGTTAKLPTMRDSREFLYTETRDCQAVRLRYKGDAISMIVMLPSKSSSLDALVTGLTAEKLAAIEASMTPEYGSLGLPKAEVRWDGTLASDLKALGMTEAFDTAAADFARISDTGPLWIDDVIHKTYLRVDEKGTEAAAATNVGVAGSSIGPASPFRMTVDRPYLMAIVDNSSGAVLFLAAIRDPRGK